MRHILISASAALSLIVMSAPGLSFAAVSDGVLDQSEAQSAASLAHDMSVSLAQSCPTGSQDDMLTTIGSMTSGKSIEVIAAALYTLSQDGQLCDNAKSAVASANQAAQLALASTRATGVTSGGDAGPPPAVFTTGGIGAPGGGGGSGYVAS